jgi:3-deoxy-manno-octulosonate cytidylyltransferase (CMP-KDO synthetase)
LKLRTAGFPSNPLPQNHPLTGLQMPLVIIPARLKSERLPDKPLQRIGGDPLIVHCWRRAMEADIGPVWVAGDSPAIVEAIESRGGKALMTGEAGCGTDRVALAVRIADPQARCAQVVNQQGDMPFLNPEHLRIFARGMERIAEMATAYADLKLVTITGGDFQRQTVRSHIGLYGFTRTALDRFHELGASVREEKERLEQLRAVGALAIDFIELPYMPMEVNTAEDLMAANQIFALGRA